MKEMPNKVLLQKYLAGKASPLEREAVARWYTELQYDSTVTSYEEVQETVWQNILIQTKSKKKVRTLYMKYAAAIVLALVSLAVIFFQLQETTTPPLSAQQVRPGSNKAVLYLDQDSVVLSDLDSGEVKILKYAQVTKLGDGTIAYQTLANVAPGTWTKLSTPTGGQFKILLSDGSTVMLNAASTLEFPNVFASDIRTVKLDGEAFFEVSHNPEKPFIVESKNQKTKVLGTKFNISSYADSKTTTSLVEGKIEVSTANQRIVLRPGEQTINDGNQLTHLKALSKADTDWKDGHLSFESKPLGEIMQSVAKWYDITVFFEEPELMTKTFTGSVPRNKPLDEILQALTLTGEVHFHLKDRKLTVTAN
ncbi:DUF4974 domain-containing protein [Sphingobacterium psychroaquaticum]|uniref:FecR family protein n=1 Tax=Sphingobacterium psychroaquaticum TaxID=561061 RepID=UPI00106B42F2|nr:FecR domain-containing protein [Sphingobacterium psychroaquaticum]QBQ42556.1 DUF4974 domain-containing protein [Sphingobacterium psychroaquaticum]